MGSVISNNLFALDLAHKSFAAHVFQLGTLAPWGLSAMWLEGEWGNPQRHLLGPILHPEMVIVWHERIPWKDHQRSYGDDPQGGLRSL